MSLAALKLDFLSAIAVSLFFCGIAAAASGELSNVEDERHVGDKLAHECLTSGRMLACFAETGFSCATVGEAERNSYSCYISIDGSCYRKRFQLKTNGWTASDQLTKGECEDTHEPVLQPGERMRFDSTNAPDFLRFEMWLSAMFHEVVQSDNTNVGWRFIAPGASPNSDFERLSAYFASRFWQMKNEIHSKQVDLLCDDDQPRFNDSRLRETFDTFDDVRFEIYADHLKAVREEFSDDDSFDLDAAVDAYSPGFTMVFHDHAGSVDQLYEQAVNFCTTPLSMEFTTVETTGD